MNELAIISTNIVSIYSFSSRTRWIRNFHTSLQDTKVNEYSMKKRQSHLQILIIQKQKLLRKSNKKSKTIFSLAQSHQYKKPHHNIMTLYKYNNLKIIILNNYKRAWKMTILQSLKSHWILMIVIKLKISNKVNFL